MTTVNRDSPVPLYFQLKQILAEKIAQAEWGVGSPIPTEQELQDTYGLSRTTVRQALNELVVEGRLVRQRGRGTFIARPKFAHGPQHNVSLNEYMARQGIKPGWRIHDTGWVPAPPEVAHRLGVEPDSKVFRLRRVRLADEQPIGYHTAYVLPAIAQQLREELFVDGDSLAYLSHLPQLVGGEIRRSLEAVSASGDEAELLGVAVGDALLMIERLVVTSDGRPVEYMEAIYCGDRFKYQITLPFNDFVGGSG